MPSSRERSGIAESHLLLATLTFRFQQHTATKCLRKPREIPFIQIMKTNLSNQFKINLLGDLDLQEWVQTTPLI
jgi:hypothetical protein